MSEHPTQHHFIYDVKIITSGSKLVVLLALNVLLGRARDDAVEGVGLLCFSQCNGETAVEGRGPDRNTHACRLRSVLALEAGHTQVHAIPSEPNRNQRSPLIGTQSLQRLTVAKVLGRGGVGTENALNTPSALSSIISQLSWTVEHLGDHLLGASSWLAPVWQKGAGGRGLAEFRGNGRKLLATYVTRCNWTCNNVATPDDAGCRLHRAHGRLCRTLALARQLSGTRYGLDSWLTSDFASAGVNTFG